MAEDPEKLKEMLTQFQNRDSGFTHAQLEELKHKFGLEIRVRSMASAVDALAGRAIGDLIADKPVYDRTHPGYDRSYDKDKPKLEDIINPVINPPVINPIVRGPGG